MPDALGQGSPDAASRLRGEVYLSRPISQAVLAKLDLLDEDLQNNGVGEQAITRRLIAGAAGSNDGELARLVVDYLSLPSDGKVPKDAADLFRTELEKVIQAISQTRLEDAKSALSAMIELGQDEAKPKSAKPPLAAVRALIAEGGLVDFNGFPSGTRPHLWTEKKGPPLDLGGGTHPASDSSNRLKSGIQSRVTISSRASGSTDGQIEILGGQLPQGEARLPDFLELPKTSIDNPAPAEVTHQPGVPLDDGTHVASVGQDRIDVLTDSIEPHHVEALLPTTHLTPDELYDLDHLIMGIANNTNASEAERLTLYSLRLAKMSLAEPSDANAHWVSDLRNILHPPDRLTDSELAFLDQKRIALSAVEHPTDAERAQRFAFDFASRTLREPNAANCDFVADIRKSIFDMRKIGPALAVLAIGTITLDIYERSKKSAARNI